MPSAGRANERSPWRPTPGFHGGSLGVFAHILEFGYAIILRIDGKIIGFSPKADGINKIKC
jgi:hypothetical protein